MKSISNNLSLNPTWLEASCVLKLEETSSGGKEGEGGRRTGVEIMTEVEGKKNKEREMKKRQIGKGSVWVAASVSKSLTHLVSCLIGIQVEFKSCRV